MMGLPPCRECSVVLDTTTIGTRQRADGVSEAYCRACGIGDPVGLVWERHPLPTPTQAGQEAR